MNKVEYDLKNGLMDIIIQIVFVSPILGFFLGLITEIEFLKILSAFWFLLIYLMVYQFMSMIVGARRGRKLRSRFLSMLGIYVLGMFILGVFGMTQNLGTILSFIIEKFIGFISLSYLLVCIWEYRQEKENASKA